MSYERFHYVQLLTILLLIVVANSCTPTPSQKQDTPTSQSKKVIYYGWGAPYTGYIRQHWREMEKMPFDGIGILVPIEPQGDYTTANQLGRNLFGPKRYLASNFAGAVEDLQTAKWQKFTDNFLAVAISTSAQDHDFNWFDENRWRTIVNNWRVIVTIAKDGGCKGLILDPEPYNFYLFKHTYQKERMNKSFDEYVEIVRQRGKTLMEVTQDIFPSVTILCLHGYETVWNGNIHSRNSPKLEMAEYGLFMAFLDGFLEVASPQTRIVDGNEVAYGFKKRNQFERAYDVIQHKTITLSAFPDQYARNVKVGFGLWLDKIWYDREGRKHQWNPENFKENYFQPVEFEAALQNAIEVSDRYVWIYSQVPKPFPPANFPEAYLQSIARTLNRAK